MAVRIQGTTVIDDGRNAVNINDVNASGNIDLSSGNGYLGLPSGTTAERPASPSVGDIRFNTDESALEQYNGSDWVSIGGGLEPKATLDQSIDSGQSVDLSLSEDLTNPPLVSVTKEVPQTNVTNSNFDVASNAVNFTFHDTAYDTTLTPSSATGNGTFTLGSGSFDTADVGKRIVGNGGEAVLTSSDGSYKLIDNFNDNASITANNWSMFALSSTSENLGLILAGLDVSYDISLPAYTGNSFDITNQTTNPTGVSFKTDGTKMYVSDISEIIYEYNLSTAWNVTTATYSNNSLDVSGQDGDLQDFFIRSDGFKLYIVGSATREIYEYDLSTAWDVSTASYSGRSHPTDNEDSDTTGVFLKPDGLKMYVVGASSDALYEYDLSTAWDVSTANYSGNSFDLSNEGVSPEGVFFKPDGTAMFIADITRDTVFEYKLSSPWSITTASYTGNFMPTAPPDFGPFGLFIKPDGKKLFIAEYNNDQISEYNIGEVIFAADQYTTAITSTSVDTKFWTDINSMVVDETVNDGEVYYALSNDDRTTWKIIDDSFGERNIVRNNSGTWQYNFSTTYTTDAWVDATVNDEFSALNESMEVTTNRMNANNLESVTDPNHLTLGDDLDLAILLYASTGSDKPPISDGVLINYDGNVTSEGAVLGTDYTYSYVNPSILKFTALSTENFKIRVV